MLVGLFSTHWAEQTTPVASVAQKKSFITLKPGSGRRDQADPEVSAFPAGGNVDRGHHLSSIAQLIVRGIGDSQSN
jgi:hypothetical protein